MIEYTPEKKKKVIEFFYNAVEDQDTRQKAMALAASGAEDLHEDNPEWDKDGLYHTLLAYYADAPEKIDEDFKEYMPGAMAERFADSPRPQVNGVIVRNRGTRRRGNGR